ncbi:InlB B-repeat-containing protein [Demequina sp. SO4-18]|uniref:InlB B-repeat-containing protein n=1 Tax=Demequina sp. SO4-18 TaxID=3401026 RepID=UPI003B5BD757
MSPTSRRGFAALIALALILVVPAAPATAADAGTWQELSDQLAAGGHVTVTANIDGGSVGVPSGVPTTLDLAGHNVTLHSDFGGEAVVHVGQGADLTITDSVGGGVLVADGWSAMEGAAIGGQYFESMGALTVAGGTVRAIAGFRGAAIGGGFRGDGGALTVTGGLVDATSRYEGAAIGGGMDGHGGTVLISGGEVDAQSMGTGSGIGGGVFGAGGDVTVTGGVVTAHGISAIGPGESGYGRGTLTIAGTPTVDSAASAAGFGGSPVTSTGTPEGVQHRVISLGNQTHIDFVLEVGFDSNGGTTIDPVTVDYGDTVTAPAQPTREDYTFTGWTLNGDPYDFTTAVTAPLTLTASWSLNTYDITFDSAGGTAVDTVSVDHGNTVASPANPSREGYSFTGWTLGGDPYDFTTIVTAPLTLTATWSLNSYDVTFDANGGTTIDPVTVDHGDTVAEPVQPTREHYTFTGWAHGGEDFTFDTPITADTTLTAGWSLNTYDVTFDANGGTTIDPVTVDHGDTVASPEAPTRTGHTFIGWTHGGEDFTFDTPITADTTLTAGWSLNAYDVTFDADGGTAVDAITVDHGDTITAPADPTREGYTFAGWTHGGDPYDFTTAVTAPLTLTATWSLNSYDVTFDTNGGTTIDPVTVDHGDTVTAPANPTRTGHTFTGWTHGGEDFTFDTPITTDTTLTAGWSLNAYDVTFDSAGGTAVTMTSVDHGGTVASPEAPTHTGHTFTGWTLNGDPYDFDTPVTGPLSLTASWSLNSYEVTFDPDGGTAVDAITVNHGDTITAPADPTRDGYTFAGWTLNGDTYEFSEPVTGSITIAASWSLNSYDVEFDSAGGTAVVTMRVDHGDTITAPVNPTRDGYTFTGWTLNGDSYDFTTAVTAPLTLTATWSLNSYDVTFDTNGGTTIDPVAVDHGNTVTAPANPTREGYTFTGWTLDGDAYAFDSSVKGDVTLVANWTAISIQSSTSVVGGDILDVRASGLLPNHEYGVAIRTLTGGAGMAVGGARTLVETVTTTAGAGALSVSLQVPHDASGPAMVVILDGDTEVQATVISIEAEAEAESEATDVPDASAGSDDDGLAATGASLWPLAAAAILLLAGAGLLIRSRQRA